MYCKVVRVLLIFNGSHQSHLMKAVCDNVSNSNILIDYLDKGTGFFYSQNGIKQSFLCRLYQILDFWGGRRLRNLFGEKMILSQIEKYDIIDIQGLFSDQYPQLIPILKKKKKIKVTIWGSDFYRRSDAQRKRMTPCYTNADIIQLATPQMKSDFLKTYPQYTDKIRVNHFGLSQLEILKELIHNNNIDSSYLEIPEGKMVVTCAYNAQKAQRHLQIIDAIMSMPQEIKESVYILFPMTYGGMDCPEYKKSVESKLEQSGLAYKILSKHLSLTELMALRLKSNVVVNIQTSDAFSASLQEHIMAGNLVVVGDWLPYQILEEHGIYIRRTSIENLSQNIQWAIVHYKEKKEQLEQNWEKMYHLSSWKYRASIWANIYKEMMRNG